MFACLLIACLTVNLFLYWWLWRVWNLAYTVSQKLYYFPSHRSLISVLLSCITFSCIAWCVFTWCASTYRAVTWHLSPTCYLLTWYFLTSDMWSPDTCHAWYLTLKIITIREWWPNILIISWYIPVQSVLIQHVLMIHLAYFCSFRTLIII